MADVFFGFRARNPKPEEKRVYYGRRNLRPPEDLPESSIGFAISDGPKSSGLRVPTPIPTTNQNTNQDAEESVTNRSIVCEQGLSN